MSTRTILDELLAESTHSWDPEQREVLGRVNVVLLSKVFDKKAQGLTSDEILGSLFNVQVKKEKRQKEEEERKVQVTAKAAAPPTDSPFGPRVGQKKKEEAAAPPPPPAEADAGDDDAPPPPPPPEDDDDEEEAVGRKPLRKGKRRTDDGVLDDDADDTIGGGGDDDDGAVAGRVRDVTRETEADLLAGFQKKKRPTDDTAGPEGGPAAGAPPEEGAAGEPGKLAYDDIPADLLEDLTEEEEEWLFEESEKVQGDRPTDKEVMEERGKEDPARNQEMDQEWEPEDDLDAEAQLEAERAWDEEQQRQGQDDVPPIEEDTAWDEDDAPSDEELLGDDDLDPEARRLLEEELEREWEEEERKRGEAEAVLADGPDQDIDIDDIDNPAWLKPHFTVLKYDPKAKLTSKKKRVWAVDFCQKDLRNLDIKGGEKKSHQSSKLLMFEKNIMNHNMAKLMFFDAHHAYELIFRNGTERERFYECCSAIRPSMRLWCPDLCKDGADNCRTTIKSNGKMVDIDVAGKTMKKEVRGETTINASRIPTEDITVWTGSFNLGGNAPPPYEDLERWLPRNKYDIVVIAVQDAQYRKEENDWYRYIAAYMGRDYIVLAQMSLWDCCLCLITRKKHMMKIANVEGHTKATSHPGALGNRGACAISMRYHETSLCFVNVHLPDGVEKNRQRQGVIEEILDDLRIANKHTDILQQFHHTFVMGTLNYRVEQEFGEAVEFVEAAQYDELLKHDQLRDQQENDGVLTRFCEHPIDFRPTAFYEVGTLNFVEAAHKRDMQTPSYTDRILWKNADSAWPMSCSGYSLVDDILTSDHLPLSATFNITCQRPFVSVFGHDETPVCFKFGDITVAESTLQPCKTPMLMLWANHVDGPQFSKPLKQRTATPTWGAGDLPVMRMMVWHDCFQTTHQFIIMLRDGTTKSSELKGTAVLGLRDMCSGEPTPFDVPLEHHGRHVGRITGQICKA